MSDSVRELLKQGKSIDQLVSFFNVERFYNIYATSLDKNKKNFQEIELASKQIGFNLKQAGCILAVSYSASKWYRIDTVSPSSGYAWGTFGACYVRTISEVGEDIAWSDYWEPPMVVLYVGKNFKKLVKESKKAFLRQAQMA